VHLIFLNDIACDLGRSRTSPEYKMVKQLSLPVTCAFLGPEDLLTACHVSLSLFYLRGARLSFTLNTIGETKLCFGSFYVLGFHIEGETRGSKVG
jgi:hypothetical protein